MTLARAGGRPDLNPLVEPEEGFAQEVSEHGHAHRDGREAAGFAATQVAEHRGCLVDGAGDEFGVGGVRGVPVATVENADQVIVVCCWEGAEESDKTDFVVDLELLGSETQRCWVLTLRSGREDILRQSQRSDETVWQTGWIYVGDKKDEYSGDA